MTSLMSVDIFSSHHLVLLLLFSWDMSGSTGIESTPFQIPQSLYVTCHQRVFLQMNFSSPVAYCVFINVKSLHPDLFLLLSLLVTTTYSLCGFLGAEQ